MRRSAMRMAPLLVANANVWQWRGWKSATVMTFAQHTQVITHLASVLTEKSQS